jgi:hypothetical protein
VQDRGLLFDCINHYPYTDFPFLRELEGIPDQIEKDLAKATRIPPDRMGDFNRYIAQQFKPLLIRPKCHCLQCAFNAISQGELHLFQFNLACFDLGEIKYVVLSDDGRDECRTGQSQGSGG